MSKPTTCTCPKPSGFLWFLAPCNEDGWHCDTCRCKAPGEPPGYRPDLDVSCIEEKVTAVLMGLHDQEFVYVSNSDQGEGIIRSTVRECEGSGFYDQGSMIRSIMGGMGDGEFWKERGDAIRDGADKRERCACGKLATSFAIRGGGDPPIPRCPDCAWDNGLGLLAAESRKPGEPEPMDPWEAYAIWEAKYRDDHPDDQRDSLGLIEEYAKVPTEELTAFFDGIERDRAKGGAA